MSKLVHNDEPTKADKLDRSRYANALSKLATTCETPITVGVYGGWGVGKTSLMKMIEENLPAETCRAVWFNAWEHQFDDAPAVALLQSMVEQLKLGEEAKKIIFTVSLALGASFLKKVSGITTDDIKKIALQYEEENYQIRDARIRLKEHFSSLVETAIHSRELESGRFEKRSSIESKDEKRIVFFVDDLDRCNPHQSLAILEAIKLHLNIPNCVFFIGVDRHVLEKSVSAHYKEFEFDRESYLDKLIQLPFTIPPISSEAMNAFVEPLLIAELQSCKDQLVLGLGDSPRQVKRFVNTLTLNHELALGLSIPNYSPELLSTLLLLQQRAFDTYQLVSVDPKILIPTEEGEISETLTELIGDDSRLLSAIESVIDSWPVDIQDILPHLHLTKIISAVEDAPEYESGRYDLFTEKGKNGSVDDVDFLMARLEDSKDIGSSKLIDYALDLVETEQGVKRIEHFLMNGSEKQRNYATLTLRRRGRTDTVEKAYSAGLIDKNQALAK